MATFRQNNWTALLTVSPWTSYKTMRKMIIANPLAGMYCCNFPQYSRIYNFFNLTIKRSIPQHMANDDFSMKSLTYFVNCQTIFQGISNWFF